VCRGDRTVRGDEARDHGAADEAAGRELLAVSFRNCGDLSDAFATILHETDQRELGASRKPCDELGYIWYGVLT
jgi:hypothetical protein